ncbi:hypothetical protein O3P69_002644 [Scylla paramamosain]|uniref:Ubiquitin-like protein ATG12 n=1 Tax=Scylla paramamosain TaxID=85552 RepID=A0AAW0UP31_SCYPA
MEEEGQIQEPPALGVDGQPPPQETKQEQGSKVQPTKKSNLPSLPTLALGGQFIKQKFRMALLVDVLLKATGDAPIMKKKKWAVEGEKRVGWVADFIRKYLKMDQNDSLRSPFLETSMFTTSFGFPLPSLTILVN